MPKAKSNSIAKTAVKAAKSKKTKDDDSLLEFEQFLSQKPKKSNSRLWLAMALIIIIILLSGAWLYSWRSTDVEPTYKFKAVYLDNDQVYYAKVVREDTFNIYLDDVYYIQMEQQSVPAEEEGAEPELVSVPTLVKRGQELHQPIGWMQLNRDKVVAIEEIGQDSEILKEINRQEAQN